MNATSPKLDAKEVFKKSIRLLSDTQEQLGTMRKVLDKTVVSLKTVSHNGDTEINDILIGLKSPEDKADIDLLDEQLDNLLLIIKNSQTENTSDSSNASHVNMSSTLVDIVSGLTFKSDTANKQKKDLLAILKQPEETNVYWESIISKTTTLVNQSVESLRQKNSDLQGFIAKVNKQLVDIKSFVKLTQESREESIHRSAGLKDAVESSVGEIQNKVSSANDIDGLKTDISGYLDKIREEVENNDMVEQEKEKTSVESYQLITSELSNTQAELADLKEELKETKSQLLHDSLTGLYNRLAYEDRVEVEFSRSKRIKSPLCLAMWDIDYFKKVNDTYGHDVGDKVLKAFSTVIMKRIRKTDMFARIGGEEFVLLMPDTSSEVALTLNNELREIFLKCKFSYDDVAFSCTASVGLADFDTDSTPESVLKKADLALYQSKDTGRNRCTIYTEKEDTEKEA